MNMLAAGTHLAPGPRSAEFGCIGRRFVSPFAHPVQHHAYCLSNRPVVRRASAETYSRDVTAPRLIQHKSEAYWFYAGLSQVYDHIVNPGHWTEDMREGKNYARRYYGRLSSV